MPIYEYRCDSCGQHLEVLQKMSDAPQTTCKHCGADALQRVMSRTSFVLKGSGWYATDYGANASKAPAGDKSGGDAGPVTPKPNTESTPAATTDPKPKSDGGSKTDS
jgi:putative FmdB family regulatory protein